MNIKLVILTCLLIFLACFLSFQLNKFAPIDKNKQVIVKDKIETHYLILLSGGTRRSLKIDPPATKIVITYNVGVSVVRCGDNSYSYSCYPGRRLELIYPSTNPVTEFWGENQTLNHVRLRIDIYRE